MQDNRIRGRKGVELRKRRLEREPLCRHCKERGFVTEAVTPDHIIPLKEGGTEAESNIQCLCAPCHAIKTASEAADGNGSANHPEWLKPSTIPLTIVCGPPCAGKSTYVEQHARPGDVIIDLDDIAKRIDPEYQQWAEKKPGQLSKAIRARNSLLGSLSKRTSAKAAWFIIAAATVAERKWWHAKLGGEVVFLDPGSAECKRRALARGTPQAAEGIDKWYRKARQPWHPKGAGDAFTNDGRVVW